MSNTKKIPKFNSSEEEAEFWSTHDSTEYVDWSKAKRVVFPNLKPSTTSISLRLPEPLLACIKALANEKDVPYQSLMKVYLSERVAQELNTRAQQEITVHTVQYENTAPQEQYYKDTFTNQMYQQIKAQQPSSKKLNNSPSSETNKLWQSTSGH